MADETTNNSNSTFIAPQLNGRKVLYTAYSQINKGNIVQVLNDVLSDYEFNKSQIIYLKEYRKGVQPVLFRKKIVRDDIKNIVIENRANEIVNFKTGYLLGEPIQYVARDGADSEDITNLINEFNNYCYLNKKSNVDKDIADYMYTCGTAYRLVLPNPQYDKELNNIEPPFLIYALDPATCGVVYYTGLGHPPLFSIQEIKIRDKNNNLISKYCIYTDKDYFEIVGNIVIKHRKHDLHRVPLIEYPLNTQRLGAFEPVITILDAINKVASNRVDAIEQTVQSLMVFYNLNMDEDSIKALKELGAISISSNKNSGVQQDVKYLSCELSQTEAQSLMDYFDKIVLTLCGMPNRNGGYSTSDTGSAVIMRDGWSDAEARAKQDELVFRASEIDFLKLALSITAGIKKENQQLFIPNIDIRFTRRNYENMEQKATVLTQLLASDWIDRETAFTYCGMFSDPELVYKQGKEYHDSLTREEEGVIKEEEPQTEITVATS